MSLDTISEGERLIREAVRRATGGRGEPIASSGGAGGFVGIPGSDTTAIEDEDGVVQTGHSFMLGVDALGDPYAGLGIAPPSNI